MKIQILSDLHLEYNYRFITESKIIKPVGDVLIIAGDLCPLSEVALRQKFIDGIKDNYEKVIIIPGNHEYYFGEYSMEKNLSFIEEKDNVVFLNNQSYEYNGIRFLGSLFWSGATQTASRMLNDFRLIKNFTVQTENFVHDYSVEWIDTELKKETKLRTVVISHHLPLQECVSPRYVNSPINSCFSSDQKDLFKSHNFDLWVHGHSHDFFDITHEGKVVVRNPLGVTRQEINSFKGDFIIELG